MDAFSREQSLLILTLRASKTSVPPLYAYKLLTLVNTFSYTYTDTSPLESLIIMHISDGPPEGSTSSITDSVPFNSTPEYVRNITTYPSVSTKFGTKIHPSRAIVHALCHLIDAKGNQTSNREKAVSIRLQDFHPLPTAKLALRHQASDLTGLVLSR